MTLRELVSMVDGRQRDDWTHTSAILAMLANTHRDPKRTTLFKPSDFNPTIRRRVERPPKVSLRVLKQVFVDRD